MKPWVDISDAMWDQCRQRADILNGLAEGESTNENMCSDPRFIGEIGVAVYATLLDRPLDEPATLFDGGVDFPGINVKATKRYNDPKLMLKTTLQVRAKLYYLIAVDLVGRRWYPVGYATAQMLRDAPVVEQSFGPARTLEKKDLLNPHQLIAQMIR